MSEVKETPLANDPVFVWLACVVTVLSLGFTILPCADLNVVFQAEPPCALFYLMCVYSLPTCVWAWEVLCVHLKARVSEAFSTFYCMQNHFNLALSICPTCLKREVNFLPM